MGWEARDAKGKFVKGSKSLKLIDTPYNRKTAEAYKFEKLDELNSLRYEFVPIMLSDATGKFINYKKSELSKKGWTSYESALKKFEKFAGRIPMSQINPELIIDYRLWLKEQKISDNSKKTISKHTIYSYLKRLKAFFEWCVLNGFIGSNPIAKIKPPKAPGIVVIPDHLRDKLLKDLNQKNHRLAKFFFLTGWRRSEAVNLQWEDIDWENEVIKLINKGDEERFFPLYPELKTFLQSFRKESGSVFGFKSTDSLSWFVKQMKKSIGNKYSIHDIRRTFSTKMAGKLTELEHMEIMRHESIQTTRRSYAYLKIKDIGKKL